jgi:transcription initiation factor TFIIIB Brf1 subunit/transcription initiation factor TFIIB
MDFTDIDSLWKDFTECNSNQVNDSNQNIDSIKKCKNCENSSENFITDITQGDVVCPSCGLIQESHYITEDPEWNNYTEDGVSKTNNIRCGTFIDPTNPYDNGNTFIPKYMWTFHYDSNGIKRYTNLSKMAIRISYSSKQRAFDEGKYSFEQMQSRLELTENVFNTAKLFWGIILKTDILKRGGNRRGMKACCIFYACLSEKQQRNREDIAAAFDINGSNDFTKGEKIFREIFEKNTEYSWILYKNSDNESMYSRYISELNLPYKTNKIMHLIKEHCQDHLLGIAAKSEIAGLLFYTCKEIMNLKQPNKSTITTTVGICNPTLNKVVEILKYFYSTNPELKKKLVLLNT